MQLYGRLCFLYEMLEEPEGGGSGSHLAPTTREIEVNEGYGQLIAPSSTAWRQFVDLVAYAFNELLKSDGLALAIQPCASQTRITGRRKFSLRRLCLHLR